MLTPRQKHALAELHMAYMNPPRTKEELEFEKFWYGEQDELLQSAALYCDIRRIKENGHNGSIRKSSRGSKTRT